MTKPMAPLNEAQHPEHPTTLWARREEDPESSRRGLTSLRETMTLTAMAELCHADKSELRAFLAPSPPAEQIQRLNRLLDSIPRNRVAIAETIAELRSQGWSMGQIGRATGRSRQRIAVLAENPDVEPFTESRPGSKQTEPKPRPAPHYRQARSLSEQQLEPLLLAHQHYLSTRSRRRAGHPDRIAAEQQLADAAQSLSRTSRVPLAALSAHLGMARATLPAICRRAASASCAA